MQAAPAHSSDAVDLCAALQAVTLDARSDFLVISADAADPDVPPSLPGAEKCTLARTLSGTNAYHCRWSFPYRDAAARSRFSAFDGTVRRCFGVSAGQSDDQSVNHPDSYNQYQYRVGPVGMSVSLKDKAALEKTYVFISVQGVTSGPRE